MNLFERFSLLIWKMKHHDEIIIELESELAATQIELKDAKLEIKRLRTELKKEKPS